MKAVIVVEVAVCLLGLPTMSTGSPVLAGEACSTYGIGVDTVGAHYGFPYLAPGILGKANGQSFTATDTLIRSITAWRTWGEDSVTWPVKLWITRMGPDGYPAIGHEDVLLEGPSKVFVGDGVHPVELRYDFDPPFELPGPGQYAFFMQGSCGYTSDLMTTQPLGDDDLWPDAYPGGQYWRTGRSFVCALDGVETVSGSMNDLLFAVEFCADRVTTVRSKTWGELKQQFRRRPSGTGP